MTNTFTKAAVAEAIDQLVVERGEDYLYPRDNEAPSAGCFYSFDDGTPGCLVGAVIAKLDPEAFQKLVDLEKPRPVFPYGPSQRVSAGSATAIVSTPARSIPEDDREVILVESDGLVRALRNAQIVQDGGKTWGEARAEFIASVTNFEERARLDANFQAILAGELESIPA